MQFFLKLPRRNNNIDIGIIRNKNTKIMRRINTPIALIVVGSLCFLALPSGSVAASESSDWYVYTKIHADFRSDLDPDSNQDASDTQLGLAALYQKDYSRLRLLGEAYATNDRSDIERLKLGWRANNNTTIWIGQYHNPVGYWNRTFHHGSVEETASHRPGIAEYEENGGVIPMHLVGLMVEYTAPFDGGKFEYSFAVGEGPSLTADDKLDAVNITGMGQAEHDTSATFGIAVSHGGTALADTGTTTGLFISRSVIPAESVLLKEIQQDVFGGYFHVNWSDWDLIWAYYSVTNALLGTTGSDRHSFGGGYAQIEYDIDKLWIAYLRIEDIQGAEEDPYLALFPDFISDRNLIGLKFNFRKKQSLSFEIHEARLVEGEHLHTSIQWTAEFPR